MKRALWWLALLAVVFLAGYGPMYVQNRALQQNLDETRDALQQQLIELESRGEAERSALEARLRTATLLHSLGSLRIELDQGNVQAARERSTKFFDGLADLVFDSRDATFAARLKPLYARRDEITADLASMSPAADTKLETIYVQLAELVSEKETPEVR